MLLGGVIERRYGARVGATIGSVMYVGGLLISFFTIQHSFYMLLLTTGFIASFGQGMAYVNVLTQCQRVSNYYYIQLLSLVDAKECWTGEWTDHGRVWEWSVLVISHPNQVHQPGQPSSGRSRVLHAARTSGASPLSLPSVRRHVCCNSDHRTSLHRRTFTGKRR